MCGCCEPLPQERRAEQAKTQQVQAEEAKTGEVRKPAKELAGVR